MVTPIDYRRRRRDGSQKSILEHLSPAAGNTNNAARRAGATTRTSGAAQKQQPLQSHPRLSRIMEEAKYEAYVDPFRGMVPFFSISFNNDNDDNNNHTSNNDFVDMCNPWIQCAPVLQGQYCCTSWKFQRGEDIFVKMTSSSASSNKKQQQQKQHRNINKGSKKLQQQYKEEEEVEIVNVDADDDSSSVVALQQSNNNNSNNNNDDSHNDNNCSDKDKSEVRVVQCGCPTIDAWAVEQWEKYNQQQQRLAKKTKENKNSRGGKKGGKTKRKDVINVNDYVVQEIVTDSSSSQCDDDDKNIVAIDVFDDDDDDDESNNNSMTITTKTPLFICGERKLSCENESCPCDFNPFCLASLGGILDQYRYNAAKIRYSISDNNKGNASDLFHNDDHDDGSGDNSSIELRTQESVAIRRLCNDNTNRNVTSVEFNNMVRRHWSAMPSLGVENGDNYKKKKTLVQNNGIRRSTFVATDKMRSHASKFVCDREEEIDGYCEMIGLCQNELIPALSNEDSQTNNDGMTKISVPPGLRNLGATCYLNSQLQCLAQNLGFVHGLFTWRKVGSDSRMSQVLSNMQSILARMKYGPQSVICTNDFATALSLESNEMQDPNEFARLLFDRMQESFCKSSDYRLENLLPSIFRGTSAYVTKCYECNGISETKETFMDLSIPIIEVDDKSSGVDVDVQQCLDAYLEPELLVNDNQYFCSSCMQKVDASRSLVLERMPPVLNIQLARYVFDMATFSKKKLATKVKLPRTLVVPTKLIQNDNAATTTTTTSKYILCAVQNHLGTSAHGGHYIADVMDWTTGVWYEFNDEDVSTLEQGPKSSFEPNESNSSAKCKGDKIDGSTDAYNLFYVEQSYLSQQSRIELKTTSKRIEDGLYGDDILTSIDVQRTERYNCEKEQHKKDDLLKKRLVFRSNQIVQRVLCSESNLFDDAAQSASGKAWVDAAILKRFFSCEDGLEDIFRAAAANEGCVLDDLKYICSHSNGLHPKAARKGKLLSRTLYDELDKILLEEFTQFTIDEGTNGSMTVGSILPKKYAVDNSSLICEPCGIHFQSESRKKLEMFNKLISVYEDLAAGQNDLDLDSDLSQADVFVISRPWVTSLKKCVETNLNVMIGKKNVKKHHYFGGVDSLYLDGVSFEDGPKETISESSERENLDCRVNTAITCEHGKCHAMYKRRSVRLIPATVWSKILTVFPKAISHNFELRIENSVGNCIACFQEKQNEDIFPVRLTEWRDQVKIPGALRDLYMKDGSDGKVSRDIPPEIEIFLETCAISGDTANKLTCYIVDCREIQLWRDAYDSVVKAKKARKTNDFIRKQLNALLFNFSSDDLEARRWNVRYLTCRKHERAVGFPSPDIDTINGDVSKLKEWLLSISAANFELLLEEEFQGFISSLSFLETILHGNNSTGLDRVTPTVSISIQDGATTVDVQPTPCTDGCSVHLFSDECLDSGVICRKQEAAVTEVSQSEVVPIEEANDGPVCKIFVHQIESGADVDVAASQIILNALSNEVQEATDQRRRLRKRKAKGMFPVHELEMALDGNLAHFRLLLHQVSRESACNQRLYMLPRLSHESSVTELTHSSDEETMLELISKTSSKADGDDNVAEELEHTMHVIMTYDESNATLTKRGTGKRMTKEERDEEDAIIANLAEKACGGWKTADIRDRGKKSWKRQEKGFQGTFLQSSLPQPHNSETEHNIPDDDSKGITTLDAAKSCEESSGDFEASDTILNEAFDCNKSEQNICPKDSNQVTIIDPIKSRELPSIEIPNESTKRRKLCAECAIHGSACAITDALDVGPGWIMHTVPRQNGKHSFDKYFLSPTGEKFRSYVSVQRHLQQKMSKSATSQAEEFDSFKQKLSTIVGQCSISELKSLKKVIDEELETR